jgi:acyl-coenzyme A thioesterase 13
MAEERKAESPLIKFFQDIKGKSLKNFPVPPFTKWLNGKVVDVKRGEVQLEFLVREEMANPTGILHGGMQSAMLDDLIGITCATLGYEGFPLSIDMHVDYLGRVKVGETVTGRAFIVREGHNIIHAMAELKDKDGKLIATGNSNLLITHYKPDYTKFK